MAALSPTGLPNDKPAKPSFAKIAAAGLKTANAAQPLVDRSSANQTPTVAVPPREARDDTDTVSNREFKNQSHPSPEAHSEPLQRHVNGHQVHVQITGSSSPITKDISLQNITTTVSSDEVITGLSSSSGSIKLQSLDDKSIVSGTTFGLDEKDSLRPDDSASVEAGEDEDGFLPSGSGLQGSRLGSDEGVRAFRDQLREISSMEPAQRSGLPQVVGIAAKGVLYVPPHGPGAYSTPNNTSLLPGLDSRDESHLDSKLLEALDSPRDRIWVLKLEQDIIDFVKDAKESSLNLPQCNSFYRMLAHKIADYYMLGHVVDESTSAIRVYKTPTCRIPPPLTGIVTPSTAASTPPPTSTPQMKILRRGINNLGRVNASGSDLPSKTTSENGESSNDEDRKSKPPVSREEREARYEAARLRIMGSAKPSESPDDSKEKQESRSSSATGRRNRRKTRADSDDGFEARSAYSNFYANPQGTEALSSTPQGFSDITESSSAPYVSGFHQQQPMSGQHQMTSYPPINGSWGSTSFPPVDGDPSWDQAAYGVHDLTADFNRTMGFPGSAANQMSSTQPYYNFPYHQQPYTSQQGWPPSQFPMHSQVPPHGYGFTPGFESGPSMNPNQVQDTPYAYGQLPSQAFPGRPPNRVEHPLPGSYKGKNFDPQSQTFVPGIPNAPKSRPFNPMAANSSQGYGTGSMPPYAHPQNAPYSCGPAPTFASQNISPANPNRMPSQPMPYSIPQPHFPPQQSPSLPLQSKPGSTYYRHDQRHTNSGSTTNSQSQPTESVIAKWGVPASLPAKPPLSAESYESRLSQAQRQSHNRSTSAARLSGGLPSFGSVPQVNGSTITNVTTAQSVKRS